VLSNSRLESGACRADIKTAVATSEDVKISSIRHPVGLSSETRAQVLVRMR